MLPTQTPLHRRLILSILALALPLAAQAHRAWLLPSATSLSSQGAWVGVDAAVSNDLFHADHVPLRIDALVIRTPSGGTTRPQHVATGQYRTTFDLQLTEIGTYRLSSSGRGVFASWEEAGQTRRWRGSHEDYPSAVPAGANGLRLTETWRRIETFVTSGAPSDTALAPEGEGLELVPVTHPNDLFADEPARFRLLIDGQPAAGAEVEIVAGGMRYRDRQEPLTVTAGDDGEIAIHWPDPGMYWLHAQLEDDRAAIEGARRRASYTATLEVLPL